MIHQEPTLPSGALEVRPTLATLSATPALGRDFELLLLDGDRLLSATGSEPPWSPAVAATIREYLSRPTADFAALCLPASDRVLLLSPCLQLGAGPGIALIPNVGAASVLRVLVHAFSDRVCIFGADAIKEQALRAVDEHTYEYLSSLLSRWRSVLTLSDAPQEIADRRQLSSRVLSTFRMIEHALGVDIPATHLPEFPIPVAFCGNYHPATAFWMQLLLILGLHRGFTDKIWDSARFLTDDELLLPAMEIPVGNRTPLPREWEECRRLARAKGMFFDVRRKRDAIRVRFCPMTPHISPADFYSVKAMAPIIEGLGEMKLE